MIETKDLMWAVWCLAGCAISFLAGRFIGRGQGLSAGKATMFKLLDAGILEVNETKSEEAARKILNLK